MINKEVTHILKVVTCLFSPENPVHPLCTIVQAASQANADQNVWLLLHSSISTALMRPSRPKQYCLQLVIYLNEGSTIWFSDPAFPPFFPVNPAMPPFLPENPDPDYFSKTFQSINYIFYINN